MSEKRAFIRIPTKIRGYARVVEGDEIPFFHGSYPTSGSGAKPEKPKNVPDGLWDMLMDLDSKMDMLVSQVSQNRIREDFPYALVVTELSGAGIQFKSQTRFKLKHRLEVTLVLSEFPLRMAGGIGKIIRVEENGEFALEFTKIRDRDTEAIVQFVFQEQREQIRGEKWS